MFWGTSYRVDRLEQCCKKLGDLSAQQEKDTALMNDHLKAVQESMAESKAIFKQHDEKEMQKYDEIAAALNKIHKVFWVATGIFLLAQIIGWDNVLQIIAQRATGS